MGSSLHGRCLPSGSHWSLFCIPSLALLQSHHAGAAHPAERFPGKGSCQLRALAALAWVSPSPSKCCNTHPELSDLSSSSAPASALHTAYNPLRSSSGSALWLFKWVSEGL